MPKITRADHLAWCKTRALQYVDAGGTSDAFASMVSDLRKHPETKDHPGAEFGLVLMMAGKLSTPQQMREFINGFL